MNVLPELRDQLTRAVAAPRRVPRPHAPARLLAAMVAAVSAVVLALSVLPGTELEREAQPPAAAPLSEAHVGCERGYVLRPRSVGAGDWRARAVEAGPLTFVELATQAGEPEWRYARAAELARHLPPDEAEQVLENGRDRFAAVGINVLVEPDTTATLRVDPSVRASVGLLTDLPTYGGYRASEGVSQITFTGCPPVPPEAREMPDVDRTAVGVAFIVEGARCVPLLVAREGEEPSRVVVSFGAGRCE